MIFSKSCHKTDIFWKDINNYYASYHQIPSFISHKNVEIPVFYIYGWGPCSYCLWSPGTSWSGQRMITGLA